MKLYFFFVHLLLLAAVSFCQDKKAEYTLFIVKIEGNELSAFDNPDSLVFKRSFCNPSGYQADLDNDGYDEFSVIDSESVDNIAFYRIFIFNAYDNFYLVDSINSGRSYPAFEINNESGEILIITGNSLFDKFNLNDDFFFSPLNCWRYEDSQLFLCNEDNYDFLITENDALIDFLENYQWQADSCAASKEILGAVASIYVNFINAGEKAKASQFLKNYYKCGDFDTIKEEFREQLEKSDQSYQER